MNEVEYYRLVAVVKKNFVKRQMEIFLKKTNQGLDKITIFSKLGSIPAATGIPVHRDWSVPPPVRR